MAQKCSAYGYKLVADGIEKQMNKSGVCPPCLELLRLDKIGAGETKPCDLLLEEQRLAKTRINQLHDPFVHRFPAELACRVFSFCCEPIPSYEQFRALKPTWEGVVRPVQLQLGAVCQYWRRVMWSNPNFWNTIWFTVHQRTPITRIFLMQEWLDRSAQLPLFICVQSTTESLSKCLDPHEQFPNLFIDALAQVLNSHLHRCTILHLDISPQLVSLLRCSQPSFPLENLALSPLIGRDYLSMQQHSHTFAVGLFPCPKYVWLSSYSITNVKINWNYLTHFYGEYLTGVECLVVIQNSPHLVKCLIEDVIDIEHHSALGQFGHVLHERLQYFELYQSPVELLDHLTFPSLEILDISHLDTEYLFDEPLNFIKRSQCPLKKFTINGFEDTDANIIGILHFVPSLSHLTVGCSLTKAFFDHLRETTDSPQDSLNPFLPNLRTFMYASDCMWFPWTTLYSLMPTDMPSPYIVRRPLSEVEFKLNIDPNHVYGTTQEAIEETMISLEELYALMDFMEKGVLKLRVTSLTEGVDLIEAWKKHHNLGGEDSFGVTIEI